MAWILFAERTPGGSHIQAGLPCQDYSLCSLSEVNDTAVFAVADGHGSRKHFRSDRGSRFACEVAIQQVESFLAQNDPSAIPDDDTLLSLKRSIIQAWRSRVIDDVSTDIWTIEELDEQRSLLSEERYNLLLNGESSLIPYGSTIVIGFRTAFYWCGMQLGDGGFVKVIQDGSYIWPIPESDMSIGNYTSSLCMKDPLPEFRHYVGTDSPVALIVYSEGIEISFPAHSMELASYLHRILCVVFSRDPNFKKGIQFGIQRIATSGRIRYDVSIAGIADLSLSNPEPQITEEQKGAIKARLDLLLQECENTIVYYQQRIKELENDYGDMSSLIGEIRAVLQEKEEQRQVLMNEIDRLENNETPGTREQEDVSEIIVKSNISESGAPETKHEENEGESQDELVFNLETHEPDSLDLETISNNIDEEMETPCTEKGKEEESTKSIKDRDEIASFVEPKIETKDSSKIDQS